MVDYSKYVRREGVQPEANTEQPSEQAPEQPRDGGLIDVVKRLFGGDRVLWIIIIATGLISTFVPAIAITEAAEAARPSIFTVTLPL